MTEPHDHDLHDEPDAPLAPDEQEQADADEAAEAEEAEAQTDADTDPDTDAEPEPEPEPAALSVTPEQHDERVKKLGQSFATYTKRMESLFEADADDYFQCPLCIGETPGFLNKGVLGNFPDEQADLVKHILGIARPIDYPASSQHTTCRECEGLGKVTTGSRVPGNETLSCTSCSGRGYTGPTATAPLPASNGDAALTGPLVHGTDTAPADVDRWDQPRLLPDGRDNPNFGRTPDFWIQVPPWGDTRGLTAQDAVRT